MATTFNTVSDLLANTSSQNTKTTDKNKADSDMFMTLLVAQLKNQDPLAPQDGAAFVAQLAQFNSLEQLTGIRESIDKLVTQLQ
jgi:flagellar basal-body rod modification protein FlgD